MVHYKPVKITIDAPGLAKVIINVVVRHHSLPDSNVTNRGSLFTSKFWSSLCYFLSIKQKLSTAFHPQMDGQTERQNSTIKAYLQAFINFEQNDWARFLPMAKSSTIMPRMLAPATPLSSSIADTILVFPIRKILILAQNQEL